MNIKYNTFHAFKHNDLYYIFDNERFYSCIVEEYVYTALKNSDVSLLANNELHMFEMFHDQNVFFVDHPREQYTDPHYDMVIISMAIFHGCNLNCKYCFANAGNNYHGEQRSFTLKSLNAAIDFLLSDSYFSKMNYYRINLVSGGEPLIDKPLFRMFIRTAFARFDEAKKHLYMWFSTNGTLLTEDDLNFISKYNIGYGISVDGVNSVHDQLRVYPDGTGTYSDIESNIMAIQKSNSLPSKLKELWGLMVYTRKSGNLLNNVEHLRKLGFSTVQMRFVRTDDGELLIDEAYAAQSAVEFVESIFKKAIDGDDSLLRLISNDNDYIGKIIKRFVLQNPCEARCLAGSYMFSFSADGKIYPCDSFVGDPNFVMGSFYDTISSEQLDIYKDLSVHVRIKCKACWAKFICGGDCYHNSYIHKNNLLIPDDSYCNVILQIIESVIACVNQYKIKNRAGYEAFYSFLLIREKMSRK